MIPFKSVGNIAQSPVPCSKARTGVFDPIALSDRRARLQSLGPQTPGEAHF